MATVAGIGCHGMIGWLAGGNVAVVAGDAGALHLCVIHCGGRIPCSSVVTVLAQIAGGNVSGILARCTAAIVTIDTVAGDAGMTELRRYPCRGGVAGFTGVAADDVIDRLARGLHAIVAIKAVAGDGAVIKARCHPRGGAVTQ